MIRRCLIVDVETTGLDPKKDQVIETGLILYSVEHATSLIHFSTLHYADANPCEAINRISPDALGDHEGIESVGGEFVGGGDVVGLLFGAADVIVAHNAEFDRSWFGPMFHAKPWLCTMSDFAWPHSESGKSLMSVALAHGIGVSSAHRALTDCLLIAQLFDRMHLFGCNLQEMFTHAMRPSAMFRALVSFEQKDQAKDAGFKWDAPSKTWSRRMAIEDAAALPFKTVRM